MRLFIFLLFFNLATIKIVAQPKPKWFLESAIRLTGDAEMVFIGPSFGVGAGVELDQRWSLSMSYTFFNSRLSNPDELFRTHTIDLTTNIHFRNVFTPLKGFYFGPGIARQFRKQTPESNAPERHSYWAAVFNAGYFFPIIINKKPRSLAVDIKAIGPYIQSDSGSAYTEILTQLMLGLRLRF